MLHRCYGISSRARLEVRGNRKVLVSDYPLREFTLNESGWELLRALDGVTPLDGLVKEVTPASIGFLEEKVRAGLLTASTWVSPPETWPEVEVIVPVYENSAGLRRCLQGLAEQSYPREKFSVTVVDDASPSELLEELVGEDFGGLTTSWRHLKHNLGPGMARNAGAGIFHGHPVIPYSPPLPSAAPILAFLDSDCVPAPDWLEVLVSALEGSGLAAVGGAVGALAPRTWLGRYEAECASLNMGRRGGPAAREEGGVPYLPACNLLVWRTAFEAVEGFRPGMRLGEDVDLCWRLAARGDALFYLPQGEVRHAYRERLGPFLRRKKDYATSEAWLRRHHPHRFRSRSYWAGAGVIVILAAGLQMRVPHLLAVGVLLPFLFAALRVVGGRGALRAFSPRQLGLAWLRTSLGSSLQQARRFTRTTMLFWAVPLAIWPLLFSLAGLVFGLAAAGEWLARRPRGSKAEFAAGFAAEALAYSLGKVEGEVKAFAGPLIRLVTWRKKSPENMGLREAGE